MKHMKLSRMYEARTKTAPPCNELTIRRGMIRRASAEKARPLASILGWSAAAIFLLACGYVAIGNAGFVEFLIEGVRTRF